MNMNFVVSSANLLGQLQLVSKVVVSKNALPILDNLLFDIKDGILTVTGSDLETTIQTKIELTSCEGEGSIAIDTKKILEILKELPDQPLTFQINVEEQKIDITSSNGQFSMTGQLGDDFPVIPSIKSEKEKKFDIMPDILYGGISSTIFATGDDELRPIMNGILIEFKNDNVSFVATDAHKLVKYSRKELKTDEEVSFILPKKPANLIKGILPKVFSDVELTFDDKNALFTFENTKLICRLIEGTYPNYATVIPKDNPNKLIVDRLELFSSLKRVSIFASQSSSLVGLEFTGNTLEISAKDTDYSVAGNETINCQYFGDNMKIGFKSNFLMEILSNISTQEVIFELSDPTRAGIILPKDNENENEDVLMILMPMMLNN